MVKRLEDDESMVTDRNQEMVIVRELATHASDIRHMKDDVDQMTNAIKDMNSTLISINSTLSEAKGGWKMLLVFGAGGGVVGSAMTKLVKWIPI